MPRTILAALGALASLPGCNVARNSVLPSAGMPDRPPPEPEDTGSSGERCGGGGLVISEVSSHEGAVFVELWNHGSETVDLSDYVLSNYNGANQVTLANMTFEVSLEPNEGLVIAADAALFEDVHAIAPDLVEEDVAATGNDTFELRLDTELVDIYGELGVDGTDQPWYFGSASAQRKAEVWCGRARWVSEEWEIVPPDQATPGVR